MVPYFKILTVSSPLLVTVAVNLRSSMELMLPVGPVTDTTRLSSLLYGLASAVPKRLRAMRGRKSISELNGLGKYATPQGVGPFSSFSESFYTPGPSLFQQRDENQFLFLAYVGRKLSRCTSESRRTGLTKDASGRFRIILGDTLYLDLWHLDLEHRWISQQTRSCWSVLFLSVKVY